LFPCDVFRIQGQNSILLYEFLGLKRHTWKGLGTVCVGWGKMYPTKSIETQSRLIWIDLWAGRLEVPE
jgi:hypothetical protein